MSDYTLPNGVGKGEAGKLRFFTQRIDGRPYVNCLPYSVCGLIEYGGLTVPATFGMRIREKSGIPMGPHRGTTVASMKRALADLLPWVRLNSGHRDGTQFLADTLQGQAFGVLIDFSKVPANHKLRRFVGSYQGGHALWVGKSKVEDGHAYVLLFDPMAGKDHAGRWLHHDLVLPYLSQSDAGIRVFWVERGQGLTDFPILSLRETFVLIPSLRNAVAVHQQLLQTATEGLNRLGAELIKEREVSSDRLLRLMQLKELLNKMEDLNV